MPNRVLTDKQGLFDNNRTNKNNNKNFKQLPNKAQRASKYKKAEAQFLEKTYPKLSNWRAKQQPKWLYVGCQQLVAHLPWSCQCCSLESQTSPQNVDWKIIWTRCFITKMDFLGGKVRVATQWMQTWQVTCTHLSNWNMCMKLPNRQTSFPAVDPLLACKQASGPLSHSLRAPGEQWLKQSPMERKCGSSDFWRRSSSTPLEETNKKRMMLDTLNRVRETV